MRDTTPVAKRISQETGERNDHHDQESPEDRRQEKADFHLDKEAIRAAAKKIDDGAVTEGYRGNREEVVAMLNDALATELLCVMRYKRHYYTAKGLEIEAIKGEFLQHAQEEQSHADQIAERIVQLNGEPDFNPKTCRAQPCAVRRVGRHQGHDPRQPGGRACGHRGLSPDDRAHR
jgi:hypothetical protein